MFFVRWKASPKSSVSVAQATKTRRHRKRTDNPSGRLSKMPQKMSHILPPHPMEAQSSNEPPLSPPPETPNAPCEDKKTKSDAELPLFPRVLKAHQVFRSRIYYSLVAIFLTVLVATTILAFAPSILRHVGFQQQQARTLGAAGASFAGISIISLIWLIGLQITERRFSLISQHAAVASRSLGVDDPEESPKAVDTLIETYTYQQVLLRWLRDLRWLTGIAGILWGLFQGIVGEFLGIDGILAILMGAVTPAVFFIYTSSLIRKAQSGQELDPAEALKDRVAGLITEVRDLRRGARQIIQ